MSIDSNTLVFIESSCLVAAAGSPNGGSSFLLETCQRGYLTLVVSAPVLFEAQRNSLEQLGQPGLDRYHRFVMLLPLRVVAATSKRQLERYRGLVNDKDLHVLAAAISAKAEYLITLDRPLVREVNQANLPIRAVTPGEFIQTVLPDHPDYARIRPEGGHR
jgi:predicted nucleic acid-binding protein